MKSENVMIKFFNTEKPDFTGRKEKRGRALIDWMLAAAK